MACEAVATTLAPDLIAYATLAGVNLYQSVAYRKPGDGMSVLYFTKSAFLASNNLELLT